MSACPDCGTYASQVLDSEPFAHGYRWRRRRCKECHHRWNTYEIPADSVTITPAEEEEEGNDADDA